MVGDWERKHCEPAPVVGQATINGTDCPDSGPLDFNAALVRVSLVQAGSFRRAANALGMPMATVSRKVAEQLGVQLLQRTTRSLEELDAGAAVDEEAEGAFARLDAAEAAVAEMQRGRRGKLLVSSTIPIDAMFDSNADRSRSRTTNAPSATRPSTSTQAIPASTTMCIMPIDAGDQPARSARRTSDAGRTKRRARKSKTAQRTVRWAE